MGLAALRVVFNVRPGEVFMSRSGYSDDLETWQLIKWRGQVMSAIRGKRGQKFLRELLAALDAMPKKILITEDLIDLRTLLTVAMYGCRMSARKKRARYLIAANGSSSPALTEPAAHRKTKTPLEI